MRKSFYDLIYIEIFNQQITFEILFIPNNFKIHSVKSKAVSNLNEKQNSMTKSNEIYRKNRFLYGISMNC